jgi:hypothetical protein
LHHKAYGRTGSLFEHPFERIEVTSEPYLFQLVTYIHRNPQTHGLIADFREWPYSSYHALCSTRPTHLRRDDVLAWFGGPAQLTAADRLSDDDPQFAALRLEDVDQSSRRCQTLRVVVKPCTSIAGSTIQVACTADAQGFHRRQTLRVAPAPQSKA